MWHSKGAAAAGGVYELTCRVTLWKSEVTFRACFIDFIAGCNKGFGFLRFMLFAGTAVYSHFCW